MEGDLGLGLVLLAFLFFGWGGLFLWRRTEDRKSAVDPKGAYPGDPKARVLGRVLDTVAGSIDTDLERTEMSYHPGDPREVMTLIMDIEQFRYLRKRRGVWQYEGIFAERDIERRWRRRPSAMREWAGMELVIPIAIKAAFDADVSLHTVRFWAGDMENYALTICRVSVEAKRLQAPAAYDWRFDKRAKGYLAPVTPHGERIPSLTAVGLAEDPYDFEQQVAQMLRGRGLTVEVTGGTGDEGVDIIAYDETPLTGGTFLVQCKRYSPDKKVGVAEVRELYGTMQEKQSAKGVLVTSSAFTTGALRFAEGKSMELIDGARLSELMVGVKVPDAFLEAEYNFSEPASEKKESLLTDPSLITPALWEVMDPSIQRMSDKAAALNQQNFFMAVEENDTDALIEAIDNGADLNHRLENGTTALVSAVHHDYVEVFTTLLIEGADVNQPIDSEGLTLLHFAVGTSRSLVVSSILAAGGDMNALTASGHSPLDVSVARMLEPDFNVDDANIVRALVKAGADTRAAFELAIQEGLDKVKATRPLVDLLRPP